MRNAKIKMQNAKDPNLERTRSLLQCFFFLTALADARCNCIENFHDTILVHVYGGLLVYDDAAADARVCALGPDHRLAADRTLSKFPDEHGHVAMTMHVVITFTHYNMHVVVQ